jgi:RHS repeat-associated protein
LYLDRQRTVRATASADGATTSASAYTDFGVLEPAAGTLYAGAGTEAAPGQEDKFSAVHLPVATSRTPVGYTSEQANPVAGLQHYYARDYQPGVASWLSVDPWIGVKSQPGTLNKYAFVLNNPTTCVDYMGNRPWDPSYNAVPDGQGSWNMYPKAGVTTSGGDTPPAFNWANPDGETPPPYVSNEPTGGTTQDGPAGHSQRYSGLPACSYMNVECIPAKQCAPTDDSSYCQYERFWQDQLWQTLTKLSMGLIPLRAGAAGAFAGKGAAGSWEAVAESMSARAAAYQSQISGKAGGTAYVIDGVKFDGYLNGVLQEAKGPGYANFVKNDQFVAWFSKKEDIVDQALRQTQAAGGTQVVWSVAEPEAANAIRNLFIQRGIRGISVIYVAPK